MDVVPFEETVMRSRLVKSLALSSSSSFGQNPASFRHRLALHVAGLTGSCVTVQQAAFCRPPASMSVSTIPFYIYVPPVKLLMKCYWGDVEENYKMRGPTTTGQATSSTYIAVNLYFCRATNCVRTVRSAFSGRPMTSSECGVHGTAILS